MSRKLQDSCVKYATGLLPMVLWFLTAATAQAADLYWNPPTGGDGTWDTSSIQWSTSSEGPLNYIWSNTAWNNGIFNNTGGDVSIQTGGINVGNLTFNVDGYTLQNLPSQDDHLTISTSANVTVTNSTDTATISAIISNAGFTKRGLGTLIVSGSNASLSGTVTIGIPNTNDGGALRVTNSNALGNAAIVITGGYNGTGVNPSVNPAQLQLAGGITLTNDITIQQKRDNPGRGPEGHLTPVLNEFPASLVNISGDNYIGTAGTTAIHIVLWGNHTIVQSDSGNLTILGNVVSDAGTTTRDLVLRGSSNGEISGTIGPGLSSYGIAVWKEGTGTWTLSGSNDGNQPFWVHDGVLRLANSNALGANTSTGTATVASSLYDEITNTTAPATGRIELAGGVNIPKAITLQGRNTATYAHLANYSSSNTISGDLLLTQVDANSSNGNGSYYLIQSNANTLTLNNIKNNSSYTGTRFLNFSGDHDIVVNGVIGGSGSASNPNDISVTKSGSGILTLSGSNPYSGGTTINSGKLRASSGNGLGSGLVTLSGGALGMVSGANYSNQLQVNDNATGTVLVQVVDAYASTAGPLTMGNNAVLNFGPDSNTQPDWPGELDVGATTLQGNATFNVDNFGTAQGTLRLGALDDGGMPRTFTKLGPGFLALDQPATSVSNGTQVNVAEGIMFSHPLALGTGAKVDVATGATFMTGYGQILAGLSGNGLVGLGAYPLTQMTLTINTPSDLSLDFSGFITGDSDITLVKNGSGTQVLSGTNSNYYGATVISGGTLSVSLLADGGTVSSIGTSSNNAGNLVINGGALKYIGAGNSTDRLFTLTQNGGALDASGTGALSLTSTGAVSFSGTGARTLTLTGTNAGNNTLAASIGNGTGGTTSLVKSGTGTWVLTGTSGYTGGTTVNAGSLVVQDSSLYSSTISINSGATLEYKVNDYIGQGQTAFSGGGKLVKSGTAVLVFGGGPGNTVTWGLGSGAVIDVQAGIFVGGSAGNDDWSSNLASVNIASAACFNGAEANVRIDALTGSGTFLGGYSGGWGYVNDTIGVNNGSGTFSGLIEDYLAPLNLVKTGTGTQVLSGSNTYTGATTISSGILEVGILNNGGTASGVGSSSNDAGNLVINGGTLKYSGAGNSTDRLFTLTQNGGALDASGTGAVILSSTGAVSFSGPGARTLTLTGTNTGSNTLAASIGNGPFGATSLVKSGTGTWVLTGTSGYTGGTTINAGTLKLNGGDDLLSTTGAITITGGVLDIDPNTQHTSGAVSFQGGTVQNGTIVKSGAPYDGQAGMVSTILDGSVGLTKTTTGTLTLSASNTYTGDTLISGGTLIANKVASLPGYNVSGKVTVNAGGTLAVRAGATAGEWTASEIITLQNSAVFNSGSFLGIDTSSDNFSYSDVIGGSIGLSKLGCNTLTLTASNTYTGGTIINDGTLKLSGGDDRLSTTGAITLNGGVLDLENNTQHTSGIVNFQGGTVQNGTIFKTGADYDFQAGTVSASLAGSVGLTKSSTGTLTLTASNSYTGATTITDGTLNLSGGNDLLSTTGAIMIYGGVFDLDGNTQHTSGDVIFGRELDLGLKGQHPYGSVVFQGGDVPPGTIVHDGDDYDGRCGGPIWADLEGTAGLTKTTAGTLTLGASNSYNGGTKIRAGILSVSILADGGSNSGVGRSQSDASNLVLNGGTLQYTGPAVSTDRAFQLGLGVSAGTLDASGSGAVNWTYTGTMGFFGSDTLPRTLTLTGTNTGDNTLAAIIGNVSSNPNAKTSLVKSGSGTWVLSGANTYTGGTTISDGMLKLCGGNDRLSGTGAITITGGVLDLGTNTQHTSGMFSLQGGTVQNGKITKSGDNYDGQAGTVSAVLDGAVGLAKTTAGTLTISATNTYTGDTTISSGHLQLGGDNVLPYGSGTGNVNLTGSSSVLEMNNYNLNINGLSGTDGIIQNSGGSIKTLTFGNNDASGYTYAGSITSNVALAKVGTGTQTISGTNTYVGDTTINNGTLKLGGPSAFPGGNVNLTSSSAILELNDNYVIINGLNGTAGSVRNSGTNITGIVLGYDNGNGSYAGTIDGNLVLYKFGSGTQILSGSNTYTLGTGIIEGQLQLGADNPLPYGPGKGPGVVVGLFPFPFYNSILEMNGHALNINGLYVAPGGIVRNSGSSNTLTLGHNDASGACMGTIEGNLALVKVGSGFQFLSGTNTYTGTTLISGGILWANNAASLPGYNASGKVTVNAGAKLVVQAGAATGEWTASEINNLQSSAFFNSGSFLGIDTTSDNFSYGNVIGGSLGLIKIGTNTLTLTGTNTYTGGTIIGLGDVSVDIFGEVLSFSISGGVLSVGSNVNLGNAAGSVTFNGGKLAVTGAISMARPIILNATGGGIDTAGNLVEITGAQNTTWGAGTLTVDGASGGELKLNRTGGTVSVDPAAVLQINAGAKVELTGTPATKSGSNFLKIINSSLTSLLVSGTTAQEVGSITGTGATEVASNATLIVSSISQTHISIGSHAKLIVRPSGSGPLSDGADLTSITPVPEPSTWAMLMLAAMGLGIYRRRRR